MFSIFKEVNIMKQKKQLIPEEMPKIVRVLGVMFCNDDFNVNVSFEAHDINCYGNFSVEGSLSSRNIEIRNGGSIEVSGSIEAKGDIKVDQDLLCGGNCSCYSIISGGYVLITGNCRCFSITAYDDVCICGTFNNPIENIKVPENKHIYINGKCVK